MWSKSVSLLTVMLLLSTCNGQPDGSSPAGTGEATTDAELSPAVTEVTRPGPGTAAPTSTAVTAAPLASTTSTTDLASPGASPFDVTYPIEFAPDSHLRYIGPAVCSEPLRPAVVTSGSYYYLWQMADRGVAVFDLDGASRPDSSQFDQDFVRGISLAAAELGIAVRWVRAHADEYCVAPGAVVVAGYSWGAITALALAYSRGAVEPHDEIEIDELGDPVDAPSSAAVPVPPDLAEYSDVPDAVIAHAGFALPDSIDPGEPPAFLVHGTNDDVIPFSLADETCVAASAAGVVCELVPHDNGHGFSGALDPSRSDDPTLQATIDFLNREVLAPVRIKPLS